MLTLYRRHLKTCDHRGEGKDKGRDYRRCKCPIWCDGTLGGREIRRSLKLVDWNRAQELVREMETSGTVEAGSVAAAPITIAAACERFIIDVAAQELQPCTIDKYRLLIRRLQQFADHHGLRYAADLGELATVEAFREKQPDRGLTAVKRLEQLRCMMRFFCDHGWIPSNPAAKLKAPKVRPSPTLPFTKEEMALILAACDDYPSRAKAPRLRALVLLLRFSGLRISDAVTLSADRISPDGTLFLRTAKTGTAVKCPLPPAVVQALNAIPRPGRHFFWTGNSKPKTCVGLWEEDLRNLFKLAGIVGGHAHRFRDTFATELLLLGVPIERVAALLGHQNTAVTQKHYSPWVASRQEQLEADVRRTWDSDLLAMETKGTPEVHSETRRVN